MYDDDDPIAPWLLLELADGLEPGPYSDVLVALADAWEAVSEPLRESLRRAFEEAKAAPRRATAAS